MKFPEHLRRRAEEGLDSLAGDGDHEVYALAFLVDNEDDDPRRPVLTLRHNTETRVAQALPGADDPADARWNLAHWLPGALAVIADRARDPTGAAAREAWIRELGLWYQDGLDADGRPVAIGLLALEIQDRFHSACVALARNLHSTGVVENALGRPVPILVPEWKHHPAGAAQTLAANPAGLAEEYIVWADGQYR